MGKVSSFLLDDLFFVEISVKEFLFIAQFTLVYVDKFVCTL